MPPAPQAWPQPATHSGPQTTSVRQAAAGQVDPQAPQPVSGSPQPWAGPPAPALPQAVPQQAMPVQAQHAMPVQAQQAMPVQAQQAGQTMPEGDQPAVGQEAWQPTTSHPAAGQPDSGQLTAYQAAASEVAGQPAQGQSAQGQPAQGQPVASHWGLPEPPQAHPNGHVPSGLARPAAPVKAAGWWRRNRIGLIALLPLLVAVVAVRWDDFYWYMWRSQPRLPVNVAEQQWVAFSGAEMRLAEFGQAKNVLGSNNKPIALPPRVTVWQAVLEFKAPDQDAIGGCEIKLEDSENRLYGRGATELSNVRGQSFITCTRPSEETSSEYRTTVLFLTPDNVKPVAVQIRWVTKLPSYVRLNVGAGAG